MSRWSARRRRWPVTRSLISVLSIAAVLAAGCGGSDSSDSGGILRIGDAESEIDSLNPFVAQNVFAFATFRAIYPFLVQYDNDQKIIDEFARSHSVSGDGLTYTFETFADAKWSDGKPLTSEDVVWTLETILANRHKSAVRLAPFVEGIEGVEAPSPTEVVITYDKPSGVALSNLAEIPILPMHIWQKHAAGDAKTLLTFANTEPVGAGPFTLTDYRKNESVLFERNEGYYRPGAKLGGFGFQFFKSPDALVDAVSSGELDVALKVPPTSVDSLSRAGDIEIAETGGLDVALLGINAKDPGHKELLDPQVREAIDLAIDKKEIVTVVGDGTGQANRSIIPSSLKRWFDPELEGTDFDAARAEQILDSLGYTRSGDGIREANGRPMTYDLYTWTTATGMPRILELVQQDLREVGIEIEAHVSDFPTFAEAIFGEDNGYADWDLNLSDWVALYDPSTQLALPTCGQFGSTNETGYCNRAYDALFRRQARETGDARFQTVREMQQVIARDRPLIPLWNPATINAAAPGVHINLTSPLLVNYESQRWLVEATK